LGFETNSFRISFGLGELLTYNVMAGGSAKVSVLIILEFFNVKTRHIKAP
jgi:hypothetical protein